MKSQQGSVLLSLMAGASIPNKVFVGCPYKTIRDRYMKVAQELSDDYPILFFLVGTDQKAQELFDLIKRNITSSSGAIFDITGNNANVSLEYGYAEGKSIPKCIFLNVRKGGVKQKKDKEGGSIIADLIGQIRNHYKTTPGLKRLLTTYCKEHVFTVRFEKAFNLTCKNVKDGRRKGKLKRLALRMIHYLDNREEVRREDLVNNLAATYDVEDVEFILKGLRANKIINSVQGPYSTVSLRQS